MKDFRPFNARRALSVHGPAGLGRWVIFPHDASPGSTHRTYANRTGGEDMHLATAVGAAPQGGCRLPPCPAIPMAGVTGRSLSHPGGQLPLQQ
jgi:hypothetical protein